jgi:hypothetical protein
MLSGFIMLVIILTCVFPLYRGFAPSTFMLLIFCNIGFVLSV